MRWCIEQLHRELKQLTGIERCQCRKQRAQRNHFAYCYHAWFSLNNGSDSFCFRLRQAGWWNSLKIQHFEQRPYSGIGLSLI